MIQLASRCHLDDLPEVPRGFAEAWQATDKVVYSTTLDAVPEPRTRLERIFDPEVVRTMKGEADRDRDSIERDRDAREQAIEVAVQMLKDRLPEIRMAAEWR